MPMRFCLVLYFFFQFLCSSAFSSGRCIDSLGQVEEQEISRLALRPNLQVNVASAAEALQSLRGAKYVRLNRAILTLKRAIPVDDEFVKSFFGKPIWSNLQIRPSEFIFLKKKRAEI